MKILKRNTGKLDTNGQQLGYDVEVDLWIIEDRFYFGHDEPQYEINMNQYFYLKSMLWYHAKNLEALKWRIENNIKYYFWHQEDNFTLTSNNYIWTYPGQKLTERSICVLPENANYTEKELNICWGICSDFIEKYNFIKV